MSALVHYRDMVNTYPVATGYNIGLLALTQHLLMSWSKSVSDVSHRLSKCRANPSTTVAKADTCHPSYARVYMWLV